MPRADTTAKVESFNFRVDPALKAEFAAAAEAVDKPAGQILREFMRAYVAQRRHAALHAEAARQSAIVAASTDEAEAMRWIEDVAAPWPAR